MKKLLALDGGGIRGVFTIGVLERMEALLRERYRETQPGMVLADYFDFIGGTSTGGIIAALLAQGRSVRAVREYYEKLGPLVFRRKPFWMTWRSLYGSEAFATYLQELFAEPDNTPMTLGSKSLKTHLLLVLRNGTTGSIWPLTNEPEAKYSRRATPESVTNLDLPLWQLVRASAAAPVFFPSELVQIADDQGQTLEFEFIDGGVSAYNNPAAAMYYHATLPPYAMNYPSGRDELYLCSVGTGTRRMRYRPGELGRINMIGGALRTLRGMLDSVTDEQDKVCRILGDTLYGAPIDSEIGDLHGHGQGLFQYVRYNHHFTDEEIAWTRERQKRPEPFGIDDFAGVSDLLEVGRNYAKRTLQPEHFP